MIKQGKEITNPQKRTNKNLLICEYSLKDREHNSTLQQSTVHMTFIQSVDNEKKLKSNFKVEKTNGALAK